jgi:uncharacterized membrane protein
VSRQHRWLRQEVARWRAEGLVDEALVQRLLARYPETTERGWGRIVLSALGAVLVGLGVILVFAYNWQAIPKAVKLALAFGALAAAHGAAMARDRRQPPNRALVEGLHALGTMLFGAAIWLVAQIYHIDEHYPNAFLVWSLGALALAWAMPSLVQALLALFLVAFWAGVEVFQFRAAMHAAPLLVAAGVLPLAWRRRSPALLFWALAVLVAVTAFAVAGIDFDPLVALLYVTGAAILIASIAAPETSFPEAERPLHAVGLFVVLACNFVLSFPGLAGYLGRQHFARPELAAYLGVAATLFAASLAAAAWRLSRGGWGRLDAYRHGQAALIAVGVAIVAGCMLAHVKGGGWAVALPFNVIGLALATLLILEGSARLQPRLVGAGCLYFALITVSRYADLFGSLLARAAVFVALGVGLFLVGNFYARNRRRAQQVRT